MKTTKINNLPADLINFFASDNAILLSRADSDGVMGCSTSDPADLTHLSDFKALDAVRRHLKVHSVLVCVIRASENLADEFVLAFPEFAAVSGETRRLISDYGEVYAVYVITHSNPDDRPAGSLTISIGGDCYREDQHSLEGVLERTALLAKAMARKAVMMFPAIPVLHGGKKGEWIVVDREGMSIKDSSDQMKIFLGVLAIKRGIEFLNRFKFESRQAEISCVTGDSVILSTDSASPDTLSGKYWPQMCHIWGKLGLDMNTVTCVPPDLLKGDEPGAPKIESALPTGYGVAATATGLIERLLEKKVNESEYVIEALGNVSYHTIDALINRYGVPPHHIVAFDKSEAACQRAEDTFPGIQVFCCSDSEFYECLSRHQNFDVWINNGLGNRTTTDQVQRLLACGVRVFCGGANNLLRKSDELHSLTAIWKDNAWVWPDEATSGGGWAFAVMELRSRTLGNTVQPGDFIWRIADQVERSNRGLIESVIGAGRRPNGRQLWERIETEINTRLDKTLATVMPVAEAAVAANLKSWSL